MIPKLQNNKEKQKNKTNQSKYQPNMMLNNKKMFYCF